MDREDGVACVCVRERQRDLRGSGYGQGRKE